MNYLCFFFLIESFHSILLSAYFYFQHYSFIVFIEQGNPKNYYPEVCFTHNLARRESIMKVIKVDLIVLQLIEQLREQCVNANEHFCILAIKKKKKILCSCHFYSRLLILDNSEQILLYEPRPNFVTIVCIIFFFNNASIRARRIEVTGSLSFIQLSKREFLMRILMTFQIKCLVHGEKMM